VHFDNYSAQWDEWYRQSDLAKGHLQPIYSKTQRKLRMLDVHIIQRCLFYSPNTAPASAGATGKMGTALSNHATTHGKNSPAHNKNYSAYGNTSNAQSNNKSGVSAQSNNSTSTRRSPAHSKSGGRHHRSYRDAISEQLSLDRIELKEAPYVIQCESYRSIAHLHHQVLEQMLRYLPDGKPCQTCPSKSRKTGQ
jgi:hypothetical protein